MIFMRRFPRRILQLLLIFLFLKTTSCHAYSSLTHLAIVDANWERALLPLLKQRFPNATAAELLQAHAYAYGGSIAPDLGYQPGGSKLFSSLVHYVRSGDFIANLFDEAKDINDYAFALGCLTHYYADIYGHEIAVNRSVPVLFPKMKLRFGDTVTYADDKVTHQRVEFSFDVIQSGRGNYAPKAYHDFIDFKFSKPVLERAFTKTYGLDINELFGNFSRTEGSFRWAVKEFIPRITRAAWRSNRKHLRDSLPNTTRRSYIYRINRRNYYSEFGREREKRSIRASVAVFFIHILPKIGPLKSFKFKPSTKETQRMFLQSFDTSVLRIENGIGRLRSTQVSFDNIDWDTGKETRLMEYHLADKTYSQLLLKLKEKNFATMSPLLKENILSFYQDYSPTTSSLSPEQWQKTTAALEELKGISTR